LVCTGLILGKPTNGKTTIVLTSKHSVYESSMMKQKSYMEGINTKIYQLANKKKPNWEDEKN